MKMNQRSRAFVGCRDDRAFKGATDEVDLMMKSVTVAIRRRWVKEDAASPVGEQHAVALFGIALFGHDLCIAPISSVCPSRHARDFESVYRQSAPQAACSGPTRTKGPAVTVEPIGSSGLAGGTTDRAA